jgi:hypothetical protein
MVHTLGLRGGELSSEVEGSSSLDVPLVPDVRSPDQLCHKAHHSNAVSFSHSLCWHLDHTGMLPPFPLHVVNNRSIDHT